MASSLALLGSTWLRRYLFEVLVRNSKLPGHTALDESSATLQTRSTARAPALDPVCLPMLSPTEGSDMPSGGQTLVEGFQRSNISNLGAFDLFVLSANFILLIFSRITFILQTLVSFLIILEARSRAESSGALRSNTSNSRAFGLFVLATNFILLHIQPYWIGFA